MDRVVKFVGVESKENGAVPSAMGPQQNSQFFGHRKIPLPGHVSTSQVAKSNLLPKSLLSNSGAWQ